MEHIPMPVNDYQSFAPESHLQLRSWTPATLSLLVYGNLKTWRRLFYVQMIIITVHVVHDQKP